MLWIDYVMPFRSHFLSIFQCPLKRHRNKSGAPELKSSIDLQGEVISDKTQIGLALTKALQILYILGPPSSGALLIVCDVKLSPPELSRASFRVGSSCNSPCWEAISILISKAHHQVASRLLGRTVNAERNLFVFMLANTNQSRTSLEVIPIETNGQDPVARWQFCFAVQFGRSVLSLKEASVCTV